MLGLLLALCLSQSPVETPTEAFNGVFGTNGDLDGWNLILDQDGDTYLRNSRAAGDDTVDIYVNGAKDFTITANRFELAAGSLIGGAAATKCDLQVNGSIKCTTHDGTTAGGVIKWTGDGAISLRNIADGAAADLTVGGVTAGAIGGTTITASTASNLSFTASNAAGGFTAGASGAFAVNGRNTLSSPSDGETVISNAGGTANICMSVDSDDALQVYAGDCTSAGKVKTNIVSTPVLQTEDAVSDVAVDALTVRVGNVLPTATVNIDGSNTTFKGGLGINKFTVVDYTQCGTDVMYITVNGTELTCTEGAGWAAATDNTVTAHNLAACIDLLAGVGATHLLAVVSLSMDATTSTIDISTGDVNCATTTEGADGKTIFYVDKSAGGQFFIGVDPTVASKGIDLTWSSIASQKNYLGIRDGTGVLRGLYASDLSAYGGGNNAISSQGGGFAAGGDGELIFGIRSQIGSTADGFSRLTNNAVTAGICFNHNSATQIGLFRYDDCITPVTALAGNLFLQSSTAVMDFSPAGTSYFGIQTVADNGIYFYISPTDGRANNWYMFVPLAYYNTSYGGTTPAANPTIRIQSQTNPATRTTEYLSLSHNQTNAQFETAYGGYQFNTSTLKGAATYIKSATDTITFPAAPGALTAVTGSNILPDGAMVVGVTSRVTTGETGGGCTGINLGPTGGDADLFGANLSVALDATSNNTNATAAFTNLHPVLAANTITATAVGGAPLCQVAVISVIVHYIDVSAATIP